MLFKYFNNKIWIRSHHDRHAGAPFNSEGNNITQHARNRAHMMQIEKYNLGK